MTQMLHVIYHHHLYVTLPLRPTTRVSLKFKLHYKDLLYAVQPVLQYNKSTTIPYSGV